MSATGQYAQADYIIQGVGDEVLLGATVLFGFVSVFFVLILNGRKSRGQTLIVHPSARADVETVRQNEEIAQRSNRENLGAENCPICLAAVDNPVETNCAHVFCGMLTQLRVFIISIVYCSLDYPHVCAVFICSATDQK